jgi:hypothetical protein
MFAAALTVLVNPLLTVSTNSGLSAVLSLKVF